MHAGKIEKPKHEIVRDLECFNEADNAKARGELVPDSQLREDYFNEYPEPAAHSRRWLKLPPLSLRGTSTASG